MNTIKTFQTTLVVGLLACSSLAFAAGGPGGGAGGAAGGGGAKVVAPAAPYFVLIPLGSAPLSPTPLVAGTQLPDVVTSINAAIPMNAGNLLWTGSFELYAASNVLSTDVTLAPTLTLVSGPPGASLVGNFVAPASQIHGTWYPAEGGAYLTWTPALADVGSTFPVTVQATTSGGTVQSTFNVTVVDQPSPVGNLAATRLADRFTVTWDAAVAASAVTYSVQVCGSVSAAIGGANVFRAGNTDCSGYEVSTAATWADVPLTFPTSRQIGTAPPGTLIPATQILVIGFSATNVQGVLRQIAAP